MIAEARLRACRVRPHARGAGVVRCQCPRGRVDEQRIRRRPAASSSPTTSSCAVDRISPSTSSPARDSPSGPSARAARRQVPRGVGAGGLSRVDGRVPPDHRGVGRHLRAWDFVHCPPGTAHTFVGAGDGPCVLLCAGNRDLNETFWRVYKRSDVALRYGASVERIRVRTPRQTRRGENAGASSARNAGASSRGRLRDRCQVSHIDRGESSAQ